MADERQHRTYVNTQQTRTSGPILSHTTLRHAHAYDDHRLADFFMSLSSDTLYLRYFTPRPPHTIESAWLEAQRLVHSDDSINVLLATACADGEEHIIGIAELVRSHSNTTNIETALIVTDIYQGQGIGRMLCGQLVDLMVEQGVSQVHAVVLPENTRMRRLIDRIGFTYTSRFQDGALFFCFTPHA
ncbi:MAG: hypothetical protein GFH27_549281n56 [Chloroflexi bacterium AL-W]|nr:hypothetical protein [Chloroflexi bacterium AL-N1]NOK65942.1 hypothetical protein [Chloroflexi bacterium AL-N10]NOK72823.1 hypothetical protein [Chloroflexi bacterium AL-N5]NOK79720.1 hypothetical protein [Chloroflexi bacterium AL-W]NOK88424.1 hypothetical protein [Chloroflexi bacterium AL-N15]